VVLDRAERARILVRVKCQTPPGWALGVPPDHTPLFTKNLAFPGEAGDVRALKRGESFRMQHEPSDSAPDVRVEWTKMKRSVRRRLVAPLLLLLTSIAGALLIGKTPLGKLFGYGSLVSIVWAAYVSVRYHRCPRCSDMNFKYVGRYCKGCGARIA
jgi:hypothetical protein